MKKLASLLLCLAAGSSQATPAQHHAFTGYGNIAELQTYAQIFSGVDIDMRINTLAARLSYHF